MAITPTTEPKELTDLDTALRLVVNRASMYAYQLPYMVPEADYNQGYRAAHRELLSYINELLEPTGL